MIKYILFAETNKVDVMKLSFSILLLTGLLVACGGGGAGGGNGGRDGGGNPSSTTPTAFITSSTQAASVNDQIVLNWTSTNASSCLATGDWSGDLTTNGSRTIQLTAVGSLNYGISCGSASASVNVRALGQYTEIPDGVFADALTRLGYPVTNGRMLTSDALSIKRLCITSMQGIYGTPDQNGVAIFGNSAVPDSGVRCTYTPSGSYISSVAGIEGMLNLQSFRIEMQQFSSIDISNLKDLTFFSLWGNPLASIDLSANPALQSVGLSETSLKTLDLSGLPNIVELALQQDDGRTLPYTLSNGTLVTGFSSLDISKVPTLKRLYVMGNSLTSLDLTGNPAIEELWIRNNNIQTLDLSGHASIDYVIASHNNLTSVNAKGIAHGGVASHFFTDHNPGLTTILVTNPSAWSAAAASQQIQVDSQTQFMSAP
jgi:hypothetical protein